MSLEHVIMGFLAERERSGYDLKTRAFDVEAAWFWPADQAQIYRTLTRLHDEGLVSVRRSRQTNRPDRKIHELTGAGRDALAAWLSQSEPPVTHRDPLLARLYLAHPQTPTAVLLGVLTAERDERRTRLDRLEDLRRHLDPENDREGLRHLALDGASSAERARVEWLDRCIAHVARRDSPGAERIERGSA